MTNYRSLYGRDLHDPHSEHFTLEDTGLDYFRIKPQDYERMMDAQQNSQSAVTTVVSSSQAALALPRISHGS
jgi:hypothetical protein